jgi:hypothetical protein
MRIGILCAGALLAACSAGESGSDADRSVDGGASGGAPSGGGSANGGSAAQDGSGGANGGGAPGAGGGATGGSAGSGGGDGGAPASGGSPGTGGAAPVDDPCDDRCHFIRRDASGAADGSSWADALTEFQPGSNGDLQRFRAYGVNPEGIPRE